MQNLIVLGLVPGTHIQITFGLWMLCAVILGTLLGIFIMHRLHVMRSWVVAGVLAVTNRRSRLA
jgi:hypothetical protein